MEPSPVSTHITASTPNTVNLLSPTTPKKKTNIHLPRREMNIPVPEAKRLRFDDEDDADTDNIMLEAMKGVEEPEEENNISSIETEEEHFPCAQPMPFAFELSSDPPSQNGQNLLGSTTPDGLRNSNASIVVHDTPSLTQRVEDLCTNTVEDIEITQTGNMGILECTEVNAYVQLQHTIDNYNFQRSELFPLVKNRFSPSQESFELFTVSNKEAKFSHKVFMETNRFHKITLTDVKSINNNKKKIEVKAQFFQPYMDSISKIFKDGEERQSVNSEYGDFLVYKKLQNNKLQITQKYQYSGTSREETVVEIESDEVHLLVDSCYNCLKLINFGKKCHQDCMLTLIRASNYLSKTPVVDQTRDKYMIVLHFYHNALDGTRYPIHIAMKNFIDAHKRYPWSLYHTPTFSSTHYKNMK